MESYPGPVVTADRRGRVIYANGAAMSCQGLMTHGNGADRLLHPDLMAAAARSSRVTEIDIEGVRYRFDVVPAQDAGIVHVFAREQSDKAHDLAHFPEDNPNPVLSADAEGMIDFANAAAKSVRGLLDHEAGKILPGALRDAVRHSVHSHQYVDLEVVLNRRDYAFELNPSKYSQRVSIYGRDVTKRTSAERSLRETQVLLEAVTQYSPTIMCLKDAEGHYLFANQKFLDLHELLLADVIGKTAHDLFDERSADLFSIHDGQVLEERQEIAREQVILTPQGDRIFMEVKFPITMSGGSVAIGLIGTDITAQKEFDKTLRDSEALKGSVLESALDAIISIDEFGKVLEFNPAAERTFGYARADAIGKELSDLIVPPSLRDAHMSGLHRYLTTGESKVLGQRLELPAVRADGVEIPVEIAITSRGIDDRKIITAYLRDITERKQAEDEILHAKDAAAAAEARLLDAVANMSEAIVVYDSDDRLVLCNKRFKDFYHYRDEDVRPGAHFDDLIRLDLENGVIADQIGAPHFKRRIGQRDKHSGSLEIRLTDGRWLQIRDRKTSTGGTVSIQADITELKAAEEAISEAEGRLSDAIENMSEGIVVYDALDRLVLSNRQFREFYGYSDEDAAPGVTFDELGRIDIERDTVVLDGQADDYLNDRFGYRRTMRRAIDVHLTSGRWLQIRDRQTAFGGTVSIQTDITKRKLAEAALAESQELLKTVIDETPAVINVKDTEGRFALSNPAQAAFYGLGPDELVGKTIDDIADASYAMDTRQRDLQVLQTGRPLPGFEDTSRDSKGNWVTWYTTKVPMFDADKKARGVLTISHDITLRKEAEIAMRQAKEQAESANQAKSRFLANMSHELRTPLNAILGYTELISDGIYGEVPDRVNEVVERVSKNGRNLLGLINDVLDLSKIEAGQLNLSLDDYDMADVIDAVVTSVGSLAAEKGLEFEHRIPVDLPVGHGDSHRLSQVLTNLIGNAIKFTDEGSVTVTADRDGENFAVRVIDTGPGISKANQTVIFEEFQQTEESNTQMQGGTGLGLTISKRIIDMHGGRLWVESDVGKGATFAFTVPVRVTRQEIVE